MNKYILGIGAVFVIVAALFLARLNNATPAPVQTTQTESPQGEATTNTVSYTDRGFVPATLTVKQGAVVTFINQSSGSMWVASNPHPVHTLYPGFDEKASVAKGGSYSFTFEKIGSHPYHNHLHPGNQGTIVVE